MVRLLFGVLWQLNREPNSNLNLSDNFFLSRKLPVFVYVSRKAAKLSKESEGSAVRSTFAASECQETLVFSSQMKGVGHVKDPCSILIFAFNLLGFIHAI